MKTKEQILFTSLEFEWRILRCLAKSALDVLSRLIFPFLDLLPDLVLYFITVIRLDFAIIITSVNVSLKVLWLGKAILQILMKLSYFLL